MDLPVGKALAISINLTLELKLPQKGNIGSFTAIDFKLVRGYRKSSYHIGLVRIENFEIKSEINLLVQNPNEYNHIKFAEDYGIKLTKNSSAQDFDKVMCIIKPYIKRQTVVTYGGLPFEYPITDMAFRIYDISRLFHRKNMVEKIIHQDDTLFTLCEEYNIPLNDLDAISVARACAALYLICLCENK